MSSTNRSNARDSHISDYYVTPIADIELFLKEFDKRVKLDWNKIKIIDPCAGGNEEIRDDVGIKEVYHPMSYQTAIHNVFGNCNVNNIDIREDSLAETKGNYLKKNVKDFAPQVIITNPPYNRERNDKYNNYSDTKTDYYGFLKDVIDKNLMIGRYLFLNIQKNYYNKKDIFKIIGDYSDKIIDIICWTKTNPMPASGYNITNSWEFILVMSDKEKSIKAQKTYTKNHIETSVYSENPYKKIHRAVMKPDVVEWFLDRFTEENDVIFDCFMGVGTTGVSCLENNRKFIGVELDNTYFNISKERLENI